MSSLDAQVLWSKFHHTDVPNVIFNVSIVMQYVNSTTNN